MAVVSWQREGHENVLKSFFAPKRSDLKYWYKECRKVLRDLPEWSESNRALATVDVDTIFFDLGYDGFLYIARKRHLK